MPVLVEDLPPGCEDGIREALGSADTPEGAVGHLVYELDIVDIARRRGPVDPTVRGSICLLPGDGARGVAEFQLDDDGVHRLHGVGEGSAVEGFLAVHDSLHEREAVAEHDYRLCYLHIPYCAVSAIWLQGVGHHHEMIVPLDPAPPGLLVGVPYPVQEFMDVVELLARERSLENEALTPG